MKAENILLLAVLGFGVYYLSKNSSAATNPTFPIIDQKTNSNQLGYPPFFVKQNVGPMPVSAVGGNVVEYFDSYSFKNKNVGSINNSYPVL